MASGNFIQLQTNIGTLGVGDVAQYYNPMGFNRLQCSFESKPSTIIDLSSVFAKLDSLTDNPNWNFIYDMQRNPMKEDDYNNIYKDTIESINNHIAWVYGDIYNGGLGFCRVVNGYGAFPIISYGYATKTDENGVKWRWFRSFPLEGNADYNIFKNQCKSFFLAYCKVYGSGGFDSKPHVVDWYPSEQTGRRIGLFYYREGGDPLTYGYEATLSSLTDPVAHVYSWDTINVQDHSLAEVLDNTVLGNAYGVDHEHGQYISDYVMKKYFWCRNPYNGTASYINEYDYLEGWEFPNSDWTGGTQVPYDPNNSSGDNHNNSGGDGDYDTDNDPLTPSDEPSFNTDALDTGFVNVYLPTKAELKSLAEFLFTGITENISIALKRLVANPLDYIVSLSLCHLNLSYTETEAVKFGGVSTNVVMGKAQRQFVKLNGGSVTIDQAKQGNNFMCYAPYTKCSIWIPYCGLHELPIDLIMGGTLSLRYVVDILTGSVIANLYLSRDRVNDYGFPKERCEKGQSDGYMWSYTGNCFEPLPFASTDYRNVVNGALGLAGGLATSIATGNPLPLASSVANATLNSKPHINTGGSMASCYGYMSMQQAFLILQKPSPNMYYGFSEWEGYPSNMKKKIKDVTGYFEVNTSCFWSGSIKNKFGVITDTEADELKQILEGGVYYSPSTV